MSAHDPHPLQTALIDAAGRLTNAEFRRLIAWVKRAPREGFVPPGVTTADAIDLQIRAIRHGRCAVPMCSYRVSKAKAPRPRPGRPVDPDPENSHKLCRTHRRLRREGYLRVEGPPGEARFFAASGKELGHSG